MSERHIIYVLLAVILGMLAFVPTLFLGDTIFGGLIVGAVVALVLWLKGSALVSARNSLEGKAKRRAERQERKARAQLVRDTERKVREALDAERMEAIRRSLGGPQPDPDYETMKVDELRALAAERELVGRSKMNKAQLVEALRGE